MVSLTADITSHSSVRKLDSVLYLLSNINKRPLLHAALTKNANDRGEASKMIPVVHSPLLGTSTLSLPPSGSKLTPKELSEV